jgi:hydroxymethylbilane synthase
VRARWPDLSITRIAMTTSGDRHQGPLAEVGGKGLFVKELDEALRDRRIDCAVHSLKDIPGMMPGDLRIAAISPREDPRDLCVTRPNMTWRTLPPGARVGTSSPRRRWQLKILRADFDIVPLRGNVETRCKAVMDGHVDAAIIAAAGVRRLGLTVSQAEAFTWADMLPAVGQGTLAITTRADDESTTAVLRGCCHDADNAMITTAERALLAGIGGDCDTPLAGFAQITDETLVLQAFFSRPDGTGGLRHSVSGPCDAPEALGQAMAAYLLKGVTHE